MSPIAQDAVKLMKKIKAAHDPRSASVLRSKLDDLFESMTAKARNEALAEGQRQGVWP